MSGLGENGGRAGDGEAAEAAARPAAAADAAAWATRAPHVPAEWFVRGSVEGASSLHGVGHTQRVHIHAQRLTAALGWAKPDVRLALTAALWHDIGRTDDGVDPGHGAASVARVLELGLDRDDAAGALTEAESDVILFAIRYHCLPDEAAEQAAGGGRTADPGRALRILWLLKDADALDRVRLGGWETTNPKQLRHPPAPVMIPFAAELYAAWAK